MATPVGHYLFGFSLTQLVARDRRERKYGAALAAIACLPDLDVIPGLFAGNLAKYHHGASHSLLAAVLVAVLTFFALWASGRKIAYLRLFFLIFLLYLSHIVLDLFTLDPGEAQGVPLFWPSAELYQSPWPLLPNVQHSRGPVLSAHNFLLMMREMLLFLPLMGLIKSLEPASLHWSRTPAWFYACWFLLALCASAYSVA
jgi:inner membrane protein